MTSSAQNSKQILSQKGSAATPGVSFQGDNDTGIFSSASNSMGIAAGGTKIVDVTPTGVSITGSLTPSTALAVAYGGTGATTASGARTNLSAASSGANSDITSITGLTTALTVAQGGTGAATLTGYVKGSGTSAFTAAATIPASDLSGTLAVANGGTGQTTYTDGQLLIGNSTGNTLAKATLTPGTGISITNGSGTISIAATGTAFSYPSAGVVVSTGSAWGSSLTAPSGALVGTTDTQTLTNKAITPRVPAAIADGTSVTLNCDTTDLAYQTNTQTAGTLTMNAPTGTPTNGQKLVFRLQATNAQTFSWNSIFSGSIDQSLPTVSSSGSRYDYMGFVYNTQNAKWNMVAKNFGF